MSFVRFGGLTLFQNENYHFVFGKTMVDDSQVLIVKRVGNGKENLATVLLEGNESDSDIFLKVNGRGRYCDFMYSTDGMPLLVFCGQTLSNINIL